MFLKSESDTVLAKDKLSHLLFPNGSGRADRPAPINDLLIALTAWRVGATRVTSNLRDFQRIAATLPGLSVLAPVDEAVND